MEWGLRDVLYVISSWRVFFSYSFGKIIFWSRFLCSILLFAFIMLKAK